MFLALIDSINVEDHSSFASCVSHSKEVSFSKDELPFLKKPTKNPIANPMASITIIDINILFLEKAMSNVHVIIKTL